MTTDELLAGFAAGWQRYNGLTREYRQRQLRLLRRLARELGGDLLAVEGAQLRAWLGQSIDDGLTASTVGQRLATVRPFFGWAFSERLIDAERFLELKEVRPPRNGANASPRPYSAKERAQFWRDFDERYPWLRDTYATRAVHRGRNNEQRGRMFFDRWREGRSSWERCRRYCARVQAEAIVNLAMVGGLRRIEVWNLRLDDMDADNEYVIVQGARKGDGREKERAVPWLTEQMRASVDRWLRVRAEILAVEPREHERPWLYLFINGGGRPPDPMRFGPFEKIMRSVGPWQWHRMRHTAATEMLRAGYPITAVRDILGHADIQMTMRYAKLLRQDIVHQARINQERYERQMGRDVA